jgi:hypothetical protein
MAYRLDLAHGQEVAAGQIGTELTLLLVDPQQSPGVAHHDPRQRGGGEDGAQQLPEAGAGRPDPLLQPEVVLDPVRAAQDRLADEGIQLRIVPTDRPKHPPQELQFLGGDLLAPLDAPLDPVVRLGQGRIILKRPDPPGQAEEIVDLDRVELHRGRGGEPEGARAWP